ncbi:hypothetical protein RCO48_22665 [Peribacillus frigoritolerans]|nr:hypothetical protein [Peribacillus frigoritolerans]
METLINRQPRLKERILTESEILIFEKVKWKKEGRVFCWAFCGKGGFFKSERYRDR